MGVVRAGTKTLVHLGLASNETYKMAVQIHEGIPTLTVIAIAANRVLKDYLADRSKLANGSEVNAIFWDKASVTGFVQGSGYNVSYDAHTENGLTRVRSINIGPAPGVDANMLLGLTADSLLKLFRPGYYRINAGGGVGPGPEAFDRGERPAHAPGDRRRAQGASAREPHL